jgi:2-C-methyl-D-erythritol 4-phosphate cytidylyltransferase
MNITALLPAAGGGKRFGGKTPKQFLKAGGKEIIAHTLDVFQRSTMISEIAAAVHPDYFSRMERIKKTYDFTKLTRIIAGGAERRDSVLAALLALELQDDDLVAVHDAARPLLDDRLLRAAISHAKKHGSAVVCVKARDTLIKQVNDKISYVDRDGVYYVQTPQIFPYRALLTAYEKANRDDYPATDESMIMRYARQPVSLVEGSLQNIKITTPDDMKLFKQLLAAR